MLPEAHEVINDALSLENDPDAEKAAKVYRCRFIHYFIETLFWANR